MRWQKYGLLLEPPSHLSWARSHAALPAVARGGRHGYALYFSARDRHSRSHIGRAALASEPMPRVLAVESDPVVEPGLEGRFDAAGATMSCLVDIGDRLVLYYTGWRLDSEQPFELAVGCAVSSDGGGSFQKMPEPLLPRSPAESYLTASPAVLLDSGTWRMWYVAGTGWRRQPGGQAPCYHVSYAESDDGFDWRRTGRVCIDYADAGEHAIGRPQVIRRGNTYAMWYCHRGDTYRIGYAESDDGISWTRLDREAGIEPSAAGWDSEMQAYPWVFTAGRTWLLYNGNGYGRTGIGLAGATA